MIHDEGDAIKGITKLSPAAGHHTNTIHTDSGEGREGMGSPFTEHLEYLRNARRQILFERTIYVECLTKH